MADFTSRLNELLSHYDGSDSDLAIALGVSKQTISAWKNGTRFPKKPTLRTIADYFCVDVPWLIGVSDVSSASPSPDPTETELLTIYRDLNPNGQKSLLKYAHYLDTDPDMKRGSESKSETA